MAAIVEEVAELILWLIFGFLFAWTGKIVLFVVTPGKHKPRWDLYTKDSPVRFALFSDISFWIGTAFRVVMVVALYELGFE
jgi:hypothetical protein